MEKGVITLKKLILIIMIIGGINWGLIGIFNYNLVGSIFNGNLDIVARIISVSYTHLFSHVLP